jgi:hypothetical protein
LHEERGLIPINVLMRDLAVLEFHHHHVWKFDVLAGGGDSREQVVLLCVVSEAHN